MILFFNLALTNLTIRPKMKLELFLPTVFLFLLALVGEAKVVFPAMFSNGMVLQRNSEVAIWGNSDTQNEY